MLNLDFTVSCILKNLAPNVFFSVGIPALRISDC